MLLASHLYIGGAENVIVHLLKNIDRRRFDCYALCLDRLGTIGESLNENGFPVYTLPKSKFFKHNYFSSLELVKFVHKHKIDIIHSHTTHTLIDSALCKCFLPYMKVVHTFHFGNYPHLQKRELLYEKLFSRFPDVLIAVGNDQYQKLAATFPAIRTKLKIVRNGIPAPPDRDHDSKKMETRKDTVAIGTVSTLIPQKGTTYLLDTAYILSRRYDHLKFYIAGDGPLRDSLERKAQKLGLNHVVEFLGWIDDASSKLFPTVDIFFLPSLWEAMPMVILEAMANKIPIVSSSVGENRYIIENGWDGFLFRPRNTEEMAGKLAQLIDDPGLRGQFAQRAYKKFCDNFTLRHMVDNYQAIYQQLT